MWRIMKQMRILTMFSVFDKTRYCLAGHCHQWLNPHWAQLFIVRILLKHGMLYRKLLLHTQKQELCNWRWNCKQQKRTICQWVISYPPWKILQLLYSFRSWSWIWSAVVDITARTDHLNLQEVISVLLSHESRLEQLNAVNRGYRYLRK